MSRRLRRDLHKRISSAGYQKFSGDIEVDGRIIGPSIERIVTAIQKIVAGTTTPVQLTISRCEGAFKAIILQWLVQYNLMNFDHYEVQVSDDDATWYSLEFDGTDWKDAADADTDVAYPLLVHIPIPFSGTEAEPTGRTLYYRMRQVTILGATSAWSASASATSSTIQTGDLAADIVTANKILAGTITATEIATATLQAQFMKITGSVTIGYEGTGTIASPDEGDRMHYIDGDEDGYVEYTAGAWSAFNRIKFGGTVGGLFYPFLQCLGVINPQADEVSAEFFPSAEFRVFNFENNYEDQHGVDDWSTKVDVALTTAQKKFGLRSLFATANNDGSLATPSTYWSVGEDQAFGIWFYPTVYSPTLGFSPIFCYRTVTDTLEIIVFDDKVRMLIQKGGNTTTNDFTIALPLNTWHFIGLIYDSSLDKIYLVVNDEIVSWTTFPGTWNTGTKGALVVVSGNNYNGSTYYLDEALFAPDQLIDPDIFVQHYNHNVAWNTDVSAKDVLLKPAEGGRVIIPGHYYATPWINRSDWTNVHLGSNTALNADSNLNHGLGVPLSDLLVKLLISTDGTDATSFESNVDAETADNVSTGYHISQVDSNNILIQTGAVGINFLDTSGVRQRVDAENWWYKIVVKRII